MSCGRELAKRRLLILKRELMNVAVDYVGVVKTLELR